MITQEEIQEWEKNLQLADKIVRRKHRGIPVDRWTTHEEMEKFVDTYKFVLDSWLQLFAEYDTKTKRSMEP